MAAGEDRTIDEKGRVTIPKRMRESLGLTPGEEVILELEDGRIVLRRSLDRESFLELEGCINEDTRRADVEPIDPLEVKEMWTSDLPAE